MPLMKRVEFLGDALAQLRDFPEGAREIRIRDEAGAFRVLYVAYIEDAVFVLHVFQKKTQQTAKKDLDLAMSRLKQI